MIQTILGSNGPIGHELALELHRNYTHNIRLVSRHPAQVNSEDELVTANILSYGETEAAIAGSEIVYFTIGLPMNSKLWEEQFIIMMKNVIKACEIHHSKLVFFDNTYMYPKTSTIQTEKTMFMPNGRKSVVRSKMANLLLHEIKANNIEAVICRAPEFYGPAQTQSITNTMLFKNIREDKKIKIPVSKNTLRSLIWTPDASRAMALIGNSADCYGQTWHLPIDRYISYQEIIKLAESISGRTLRTSTIPLWQFKLGALFNHRMKELAELLPRYQVDNLFDSDKFKQRFPDFQITTFEKGIQYILKS